MNPREAIKILTAFAFCTLLISACSIFSKSKNQAPKLFLISQLSQQGERYGFIDDKGKIVIQPQYSVAFDFSEGLAPVLMGQAWGYIDESGNVAIPPSFQRANRFSEGLAPVFNGSQAFFIDKKGKAVNLPNPPNIGRYGFLPYEENLIITKVGRFSEGLVIFSTGANKYGYMTKEGKQPFQKTFDAAGLFSEGLALVCNSDEKAKVDICDFIDKQGNVVLDVNSRANKWNLAGFSEGLAAVCPFNDSKDSKCGYIDKKGKTVIENKFDLAGSFSEGLAPVASFNSPGKPIWGYADKQGNIVIKPQFAEAYPFSGGVAKVIIGNTSYASYIDKQGNVIWDASKNTVVAPNNQQPNNQQPNGALEEDRE